MATVMDKFFDLGNKATKGDPVRKAQFDYILYWIIFLTFICLAGNYFYNFFFNNGALSQLFWGIVIGIFSWFNYWALTAFRMAYLNISKFYQKQKENEPATDNPFD